jgi:hypothetical protein
MRNNSCRKRSSCCESECEGCSHYLSSKCIFYKGEEDLTCIGDFEFGDNLEDILIGISDKFCALSPSGVSTVVDSCSSAITVTESTEDTITTYTVCLDPTITSTIATHTTQIATLATCTSNAITDIISDTLSITDDGAGSPCGRTYRIEYSASGVPTYGGIIYNDTAISASIPTGGGGIQLVKSFNHDYITNNSINDGDSIEFFIDGEIKASGGGVTDILYVDLFDAASATILDSTTIGGMFTTDGISSYEIIGGLEVDNAAGGTAVYKISIKSTHNTANVFTDVIRPRSKSRVNITGIDYTNLTIRVRQDNVSNLVATNNTVGKLKVQVTKKI